MENPNPELLKLNGSKMLKSPKHPGVLVIVGPTAVGKTEISLRLAEALDGEIVSMDSRLIYRGMDIGTAKPSQSEMARLPHHMIDIAEPDEVWSLALFRREVLLEIDAIRARGHTALLVGGTGQYVRALMEGWEIPSQKPDYAMRAVLEEWGNEIGSPELHRKLSLVDPEAGESIEPSNLRRVVRALEVIFKSGRKFSIQQTRNPPNLNFWIIGLDRPREELYRRVDERIEAMFDCGLVDEVKTLLARGYGPQNPSLSAIGYREVVQYLQGEINREEAEILMRRKTRMFIRRQANWFKKTDEQIHWYAMTPDPLEQILTDLRIANVV